MKKVIFSSEIASHSPVYSFAGNPRKEQNDNDKIIFLNFRRYLQ